jgi:hypothetical protein
MVALSAADSCIAAEDIVSFRVGFKYHCPLASSTRFLIAWRGSCIAILDADPQKFALICISAAHFVYFARMQYFIYLAVCSQNILLAWLRRKVSAHKCVCFLFVSEGHIEERRFVISSAWLLRREEPDYVVNRQGVKEAAKAELLEQLLYAYCVIVATSCACTPFLPCIYCLRVREAQETLFGPRDLAAEAPKLTSGAFVSDFRYCPRRPGPK